MEQLQITLITKVATVTRIQNNKPISVINTVRETVNESFLQGCRSKEAKTG